MTGYLKSASYRREGHDRQRSDAVETWVPYLLVGLVGALGALLATGVLRSHLYVNLTESLPLGLYRRIDGPPSRGDLVIACLPARIGEFARTRGYVWRGECPGDAAPIGKAVLAVAGDTVRLTSEGFWLNGKPVQSTSVATRDSRGRAIAHYPFGTHIAREGEVWLVSQYHALSFDSRYFGPLKERSVRARIAPMWTASKRRR